jgi:hypothetical protein
LFTELCDSKPGVDLLIRAWNKIRERVERSEFDEDSVYRMCRLLGRHPEDVYDDPVVEKILQAASGFFGDQHNAWHLPHYFMHRIDELRKQNKKNAGGCRPGAGRVFEGRDSGCARGGLIDRSALLHNVAARTRP